MSWRYGILSLLLLIAVSLLVQRNYEVWTRPLETFGGEERPKRAESKVEPSSVTGSPRDTTSLGSAIAISEKNIFNPDRKEFAIATSDPSKPVTRPQIVLYGVTIAQDFESASLAQMGRPLRKGEREIITLKVGEMIGGYKLTKVLPDRITLESGEDSFDVLLYDPTVPKKRVVVKTEVKPPAITTATAGTPGPAPATTPSPPAAPAPVPVPKAAEAPRPVEPVRETVAPQPRPVTPPSSPYPSPLTRGRRTVTPVPVPVLPPESSQ